MTRDPLTQERLLETHSRLRTSCIFADKMSATHKVHRTAQHIQPPNQPQALAATYSVVSSRLGDLVAGVEGLEGVQGVVGGLEKVRRVEGRLASDQVGDCLA